MPWVGQRKKKKLDAARGEQNRPSVAKCRSRTTLLLCVCMKNTGTLLTTLTVSFLMASLIPLLPMEFPPLKSATFTSAGIRFSRVLEEEKGEGRAGGKVGETKGGGGE